MPQGRVVGAEALEHIRIQGGAPAFLIGSPIGHSGDHAMGQGNADFGFLGRDLPIAVSRILFLMRNGENFDRLPASIPAQQLERANLQDRGRAPIQARQITGAALQLLVVAGQE